eukprot:1893087-Pyramimonas_sp.AAC.1
MLVDHSLQAASKLSVSGGLPVSQDHCTSVSCRTHPIGLWAGNGVHILRTVTVWCRENPWSSTRMGAWGDWGAA